MPIRFRCLCGALLKTPDGSTGRKARCPHCARLLRVPAVSVPESEGDGDETKLEEPPKGLILLADEMDPDRAAAREILESHGYRVIEATDGEETVRLAREQHPDLIVADIRLPKLSGFQVVQAIRDPMNPRNADCWQTPVIFTTRKLRGRDKQYAMSLNVNNVLEKPLTPAELCPRIERLLAGRQTRPR